MATPSRHALLFVLPRTLRCALPTTSSTAFTTLLRQTRSNSTDTTNSSSPSPTNSTESTTSTDPTTTTNPTISTNSTTPTVSPSNPIANPQYRNTFPPHKHRPGNATEGPKYNTYPRHVDVGDPFPDVPIPEGTPAHKVNLREEIEKAGGEALVIGVPAAFSPTCGKSHIPGYLAFLDELPKAVFVVSVNDPFVSNFRFVSDYAGNLANALGLLFGGEKLFGNRRMQRSAIYVNKNVVQGVWVEEDGTGLTGSTRAPEVIRRIARLKGRLIKGVLEREDAGIHPVEESNAFKQM